MSEQVVVKLRSMDELLNIAHKRWNAVDAAIGKVRTARIEVGMALLELKARCDEGAFDQLGWWNISSRSSNGAVVTLRSSWH